MLFMTPHIPRTAMPGVSMHRFPPFSAAWLTMTPTSMPIPLWVVGPQGGSCDRKNEMLTSSRNKFPL